MLRCSIFILVVKLNCVVASGHIATLYSGVLSRKGPSLRCAKILFCAQMGYMSSLLFKSPGSNMAPPTLRSRDLLGR